MGTGVVYTGGARVAAGRGRTWDGSPPADRWDQGRVWPPVADGSVGLSAACLADRLDKELLWWSKGGELRGDSAPRIAFLREIIKQVPGQGLSALDIDPKVVGTE